MATRYEAFVKPFRGRDDDLKAFWSKFDVFATIQKYSAEAKLANLPLFLEGEAYLVWDQLSDADKKDAAKLCNALEAAFGLSKAQAYRMFSNRTLRPDESVDAYAADLCRLLTQSGQQADDTNVVAIEQFIAGLPKEFGRQVRMHATLTNLKSCVEYVRRLRAAEGAAAGPRQEYVSAAAPETAPSSGKKSYMCFKCNQVGHLIRDCPNKPGKSGGGGGGGRSSSVTCFCCDQTGHYMKDCPEFKAWKAHKQKKADVNAAAPSPPTVVKDPDPVLVVPSATSSLPRIYCSIGCAEPTTRVTAVVDTGSSRNLISIDQAEALGATVASTDITLSSVDGSGVKVLGELELWVHRMDESVQLPRCKTLFIVVNTLASVRSDVLLGTELVSALGGVNLGYDDGRLTQVVFGGQQQSATSVVGTTPSEEVPQHPYPHVKASTSDDGQVTLSTDDGSVHWDPKKGYWELSWRWLDEEPTKPIGPGLGEYSRKKLSEDQEALFQSELELWKERGWLSPYSTDKHGEPMCVLSLIAQAQLYRTLARRLRHVARRYGSGGKSKAPIMSFLISAKRTCKSGWPRTCRSTKSLW